MLAELIMAKYGWKTVRGTSIGNPDNPAPGNGGRHRLLNAFKVRGFLVGVWTGPDRDLICVKRCTTNEEAERYLSPPGRTILSAVLRGLVVRIREDRKSARRRSVSDSDKELDAQIQRKTQAIKDDLRKIRENLQAASARIKATSRALAESEERVQRWMRERGYCDEELS